MFGGFSQIQDFVYNITSEFLIGQWDIENL